MVIGSEMGIIRILKREKYFKYLTNGCAKCSRDIENVSQNFVKKKKRKCKKK